MRVGIVLTFVPLALLAATAALPSAKVGPSEELKALAKQRLAIAKSWLERTEEAENAPPFDRDHARRHRYRDLDEWGTWSRRRMEAEVELADVKAARLAAVDAHVARLEHWTKRANEFKNDPGFATTSDREVVEFHVLEAKSLRTKIAAGLQ